MELSLIVRGQHPAGTDMRARRMPGEVDSVQIPSVSGNVIIGPCDSFRPILDEGREFYIGIFAVVGDDGNEIAVSEDGARETVILFGARTPAPAIKEDYDIEIFTLRIFRDVNIELLPGLCSI